MCERPRNGLAHCSLIQTETGDLFPMKYVSVHVYTGLICPMCRDFWGKPVRYDRPWTPAEALEVLKRDNASLGH
jgi:hypothetical protein